MNLGNRVTRFFRPKLTHLPLSDSALLVPGDVTVRRLGDIIPADARLLGLNVTGEPTSLSISVDQSALTGESLPVSRNVGQTVYSSSIVKQEQHLGVVVKTGQDVGRIGFAGCLLL